MPKASDPEVPRCTSALCRHQRRHRVGDGACDVKLATPTPAQAEALGTPRVRDRAPAIQLQQSFGRLRLVCTQCGAMNEDFLALQHSPDCEAAPL